MADFISRIKGRFVLGPMAAYTDIAFRLLCRKMGAAMCFTEFANADAIARMQKHALGLLRTCEEERPVGIQIFGASPSSMGEAAAAISRLAENGEVFADCIDLNFGCPAGSVVKSGAGSALLKSPEKMARIAEECARRSRLPITAKIRSGWGSNKAVEIALMLEKAGVEAITVHWRTAEEGRRVGQSRWEIVREVASAVSVPVIGNGGATTPQKAVQFLKEARCHAVMISSGALGNPRIFSEANELLEKGWFRQASAEERLSLFAEYCELSGAFGVCSLKRVRAHALAWARGFEGAKEMRRKISQAPNIEKIKQIVLSRQHEGSP